MKKDVIIDKIIQQLDARISFLQQTIQSIKESRDNETKSSAGDKYETGRAMVEMELEKNLTQLANMEHLKISLNKIDIHKKFKKVEFGSFVETKLGNYFISIAFGKIEINGISIVCISPVSPLGKVLEGKTKSDKTNFQGKEFKIQSVY